MSAPLFFDSRKLKKFFKKLLMQLLNIRICCYTKTIPRGNKTNKNSKAYKEFKEEMSYEEMGLLCLRLCARG